MDSPATLSDNQPPSILKSNTVPPPFASKIAPVGR